MKYLLGIDEAGRGSWAGPVVAGVFCASTNFDFSRFLGLTDSKKLTPKKRASLFDQIQSEAATGRYYYSYGRIEAQEIDSVGIREANRRAMYIAIEKILEKIPKESISQILIDGRDNYTFSHIDMKKVQYIVRGDLTQKIISAASIVAKVSRDQIMCDFSVDYPQYAFHLHKGYGTEKHEQALLHYGISPLHRKSYAPVKRLISGDS